GGVCPYCKEQVHAEAIKCKHCGSWIGARAAEHAERCNCSNRTSEFGSLATVMQRRNDGPRDPLGCRDCLDRVGFWRCLAACNDPTLHPGGPDAGCIGYCYGLAAECQTGPCAPRGGGGLGLRI